MAKQLKECLTERGPTSSYGNSKRRSYEADDFFPPNFSVSSAAEIEWKRNELDTNLPISLYKLSRAGYWGQEFEPIVELDYSDSQAHSQPTTLTHLSSRHGPRMSRDTHRPSPQKSTDSSGSASRASADVKSPPSTGENISQLDVQNPLGGAGQEQLRLEAFLSQMDRETSERVLRQLFATSERKQTIDYEEIQPICLQDPPKPKFKRQLSSDASDDNQSKDDKPVKSTEYQFMVSSSQSASAFTALNSRPPPQSPRMTSSTRPPPQSPRKASSTSQSCSHDNIIPATPQPEKAESRFDFESAVKSPKRMKSDTIQSNTRSKSLGSEKEQSVFIFPSNMEEENSFCQRGNPFQGTVPQFGWNTDSFSKNSNFGASYWRTSKRIESQCNDYMDCEPSPQVTLPCQHVYGYPPHRNQAFDFPATNKQSNLIYGDLPSPNSDMLTTLLSRLSPQKDRRQAFRSQSNIDHSPSKHDLQEMEQHKFPRSMSKPEGPLTKAEMQRWVHHYKSFGSRSVENSCFPRPHYKRQINRQMPESVAGQLHPYAMEQETASIGDVRRNIFPEDPSSSVGYIRNNGNYFTREKMQAPPFCSDATEISSFDPADDVKYDVYIIPRDASSQSALDVEEQLLLKAGSTFPVPENTSRRQSTSSDRDLSRLFSPYKHSNTSPVKRQQPRKGDIDIKIRCQEIIDSQTSISDRLRQMHQSNDKNCACQTVETNILQLARDAFSKIRRKSDKPEDHERFQTEIQKTNDRVLEALGIGVKLRELCAHNRKVKDLFTGSVVITMNCPTLGALQSLWDLYREGGLKAMFSREFITKGLKQQLGAKEIFLSVLIKEEEFKCCWEELERDVFQIRTPLSRSPISVPKLSPFKREVKSTENLENIPSSPGPVTTPVRCRSTPVLAAHSPLSSPSWLARSPSTPTRRERKFSFSSTGEQSPRKVFQQRNVGDPPSSPSKRYHPEIPWMLTQPAVSPRSPKSPKFKKSLENICDDQENTFPSK